MKRKTGNPRDSAKATIVMPVYNAASTLGEAFASLARQENKALIAEIIVIDDNSKDGSPEIAGKYAKNTGFNIRLIRHGRNTGLARSYNEGIKECRTKYVIFMHQDVVVSGTDAFRKALTPFAKDPKIVASYPITAQPYGVWKKFGFWQKCFFRKYAGVDAEGLLGKFDCYRKGLLLERVGPFDADTYRTAGEDTDMDIRIRKAGLDTAASGVRVIHLHSQDRSFTIRKLLHKESQYAEATGAVFRRYGISWLPDKKYALKVASRPLLIIGLFLPYVQYVALVLLLAYSILVTKKIYQSERNDLRIILLPLVNIAVLFFYTFYMLRGLVTGKQRL